MTPDHLKNARREELREAPKTLTMEWLQEHTDMRLALRAYEEGVVHHGPTLTDMTLAGNREKLELVQEKVTIAHADSAAFPLSDAEIHETLCLLPSEWLKIARLHGIKIVPPQYFCYGAYPWPGTHFIQKVIDGKDAEDHFAGKEIAGLRDGNIVGPPSRFHYAPGQYLGSKDPPLICLWEEPPVVKGAIGREARREYGRELVVHEAMHSVFTEQLPLEFFLDGRWQEYWELMGTFHGICQEEPVATSEYSELYAPWMRLPLEADGEREGWQKRFRIKTALQEELGELLSAHVRGWGATPEGKAVRPSDRDFGGSAFQENGVSRKVAFVDALLRAPVRVRTSASPTVSAIQGDTGKKVTRASL